MENKSYLAQLLAPSTQKPVGRKVWAIDLDGVIIPALTAGNACGDSAIPNDALGAPVRLAYDKAGAVRFSQSGKPTYRVAKEITVAVGLMRENVVASLIRYKAETVAQYPDEYKAQVEANVRAGIPIKNHDSKMLVSALRVQAEQAAAAEAAALDKADTAEAKAKRELIAV